MTFHWRACDPLDLAPAQTEINQVPVIHLLELAAIRRMAPLQTPYMQQDQHCCPQMAPRAAQMPATGVVA